MSTSPFNQPYEYIKRIFEAKAARNGGIVRRKIADVNKYASFAYLLKDVEARGFHLIEAHEHYVIFCSTESIKLLR
jgi:predicted GNAT superfamily acetyltransferase